MNGVAPWMHSRLVHTVVRPGNSRWARLQGARGSSNQDRVPTPGMRRRSRGALLMIRRGMTTAVATVVVSLMMSVMMNRVAAASRLEPFRVPATPLWVHSPYINWVMPADNATDDWVWHVRNDKVR